ncbi:MAG: histidine kinase [Candidatus Eisenbacteria bacterium]
MSVLTAQVIAMYLPLTGQGQPPWWGVLLWTAPSALVWGALTPPVMTLAERVRWDNVPLARFITVHALAASAIHVVGALVGWWLEPVLRPSAPPAPLVAALVDGLVFDLTRYLVLVAGSHAVEFRSLLQRQQAEALELRAELLESELQVLRMQLQPHFLFNALHAISELAYRDARLADRAITRLAELLRGSLAHRAQQEISLATELELLEAYLEIERLRAGDRLSLTVDSPVELADVLVPNLLLQPLVENALRHGLRARPIGTVLVRVELQGSAAGGPELVIHIEDDGAGLRAGWTEGLGLRSTRARLSALYGERHLLTLRARPAGGTVLAVRLPARRAPVRAATAGPGVVPGLPAGPVEVARELPT